MPRRERYANLWERIIANSELDGATGCWLWTGLTHRGYAKMTMRLPGKKSPSQVKVSRIVLALATGYEFPHDEAGHYVCFNPACVNPEHLRIETMAENLSARRGYRPCEGRWIPVLYPTMDRLLDEAAERAWEGVGGVLAAPGEEAPF